MQQICSACSDNLRLFNCIRDEMQAGSSLKLCRARRPKGMLSTLFSTLNRLQFTT